MPIPLTVRVSGEHAPFSVLSIYIFINIAEIFFARLVNPSHTSCGRILWAFQWHFTDKLTLSLNLSAAEFRRRASRKRIRAAARKMRRAAVPAEICERRRRRFVYGAPAAQQIP